MPDPTLDTATALPAAALRPFVGRYVGYAASGFEPGVHVGMPSRFLTFIVSFGRPVDIAAMPDPAQRPEKLHALVSGLASTPALIRHDGNEHGVQVEITPLGSRRLGAVPVEFGLPPKLVGQILRFERARRLVARSDGMSLARVSSECGYADQAHMTRDFHRFAGASPTAWLRAEKLPFVQDAELAAAVG